LFFIRLRKENFMQQVIKSKKQAAVFFSVLVIALAAIAVAVVNYSKEKSQLQQSSDQNKSAINKQIQAQQAKVNQDLQQVQTKTPQTSIMNISGTGTKTTQKFTVLGDWDLQWIYDCSKFYGGQGNLQVMVYNGDGSISLANNLVNQLGSKDQGVENYHTGGTFYLVVNSECGWGIQVVN
jgi:hypothetical protein